MSFDRKIFFDQVRGSLFSGALTQQQVDGMSFKLTVWEDKYADLDRRWLAYPLATSKHETASTMWPIEEYGKGQGQSYGKPDPETGQAYYGRGDVQLTWRDNYAKATVKLGLTGSDDLVWNAARALDPTISASVMYIGMIEGWFRASSDGRRQTLARYFNDTTNDAYGAREIINGDKTKVPSWSGGVSIGHLVKDYHDKFLAALNAAWIEDSAVLPEPEPEPGRVNIQITTSPGTVVFVTVNGERR